MSRPTAPPPPLVLPCLPSPPSLPPTHSPPPHLPPASLSAPLLLSPLPTHTTPPPPKKTSKIKNFEKKKKFQRKEKEKKASRLKHKKRKRNRNPGPQRSHSALQASYLSFTKKTVMKSNPIERMTSTKCSCQPPRASCKPHEALYKSANTRFTC